jgi:hypothetical protein
MSATQTEDNRMWVVMAWALGEHAEAIDVMEGCLMACEASPEEAYDEIARQIAELGQELEEYDVVLRDPQK